MISTMATLEDKQSDDIEVGVVGEETPLIGADGETEDETDRPPLKDMKAQSLKEKAVTGAAVVAFGSSVAAMVIEKHPSVYVSGTIGAGVAPYAAVQQTKLTQVEALKQVNERMSEEVDTLRAENNRLQKNVSDLEGSVSHLQEMEETLATIRQSESKGLDELEAQLVESQEILDMMEQNLQSVVLQNLINIVFACDLDGDQNIGDDELETLITKLKHVSGVRLKEDLFKTKIVEGGRSLNAVMDIIRNLMSEDIPDEQRIFDLEGVEGM